MKEKSNLTVLTFYKENTLDNSAENAAIDGLKDLIASSIAPLSRDVSKEKGFVTIEVHSLKDVKIISNNISDELLKKITLYVQRLSSRDD